MSTVGTETSSDILYGGVIVIVVDSAIVPGQRRVMVAPYAWSGELI